MIDGFLRQIASGDLVAVRSAIEAEPALVNQCGAHPFWGGRPQPQHVAVEIGQHAVFELLLDAGADPSGHNAEYDHWSPLMLALHRDRVAMRDALLARGARVGLAEALMMADDGAVTRVLQEHGLPGEAPGGGSFVAFARTPAAIDTLLAHGARLDTPDRWGTTPVASMSRLGARGRPLVAHLASLGAEVGPAELARLGDREALERLVAADASIARHDAVVMNAVDAGHHDLLRWLLARGASPNARASTGARHSALHSAAWNGDIAMVTLLLDAGADRSARDAQYDATPHDWAATAVDVTRNPRCAEVTAFLRG
jgi:ankyrin repeat protein